MEELRKKREEAQTRTFFAWINSYLQERSMKIEDFSDFDSGVNLINVLEILAETKLGRYNAKPRMRIQKIENISIALKFLSGLDVPVSCSAEEVLDHNVKMVLGLIWVMIRHFQLVMAAEMGCVTEEGLKSSSAEQAAREGLLKWCREQLAEEEDAPEIKDLSSFCDGKAFSALLNHFKKAQFPKESYQTLEAVPCLERVFKHAQELIKVYPILNAQDVVDFGDERSMLTYLSEFCAALVGVSRRQAKWRKLKKKTGLLAKLADVNEPRLVEIVVEFTLHLKTAALGDEEAIRYKEVEHAPGILLTYATPHATGSLFLSKVVLQKESGISSVEDASAWLNRSMQAGEILSRIEE